MGCSLHNTLRPPPLLLLLLLLFHSSCSGIDGLLNVAEMKWHDLYHSQLG
jgi:hypothetical protein